MQTHKPFSFRSCRDVARQFMNFYPRTDFRFYNLRRAMPDVYVNSGRLSLCYVLLCVAENFFVSYVRLLVLENAAFVRWYIDKLMLLKISHTLYYHLLKKHMDTRCYPKILSVFERQFIFLPNRMYDSKDEMAGIAVF